MLVISRTHDISPTETKHALLKVSLSDTTQHDVFFVHDKIIRDIKCSPHAGGVVLTTSLDKTMKLSNTVKNTVVAT
jgi:hypothetical protein